MFAITLIALCLLFLPLTTMANYDVDKIKDAITNKQALFNVESWKKSSNNQDWQAKTTKRLLFIEISPDVAMVKSPYINPKHKLIAKKRCVEFGLIGVKPTTEEQRDKVNYLVRRATQKHIPQFATINGVRFEVLPELKSTYVSLICKLKPAM